MPHKEIKYKPIGMSRDLSISAANPKYAYTINNMRIINNDETGDLSLINEKGTMMEEQEDGTILGVVEAVDTVVFFIKNVYTGKDSIKIYDGNGVSTLYEGNLNFDIEHPIEGIFNFETDNTQKVYWIDGINPLRTINIVEEQNIKDDWIDNSFDVDQEVQTLEKTHVTIQKIEAGNGSFPGGTVQYFITYLNSNGIESPIAYISPKYYTSKNGGDALSSEEICSNTFTIKVENVNTHFQYINLYSVITSGYYSREAKLVQSIKIDKNKDYIILIDNNTEGETINLSDLLFKTNTGIVPNAIGVKQNTLFLGNYKLQQKNYDIEEEDRENLKLALNHLLTIEETYIPYPSIIENNLYPYDSYNEKRNSNEIKHFKGGEYYRLGIIFKDAKGNTSCPIFIQDIKMDKYPIIVEDEGQEVGTHVFRARLYQEPQIAGFLQEIMDKYNYTTIVPVVVYPSINERTVLCQGVLNPAVCSYEERQNVSGNFASSSWFFRPIQLKQMNTLIASTDSGPVEFRHMFGIASSAYNSNAAIMDEGKEYPCENITGAEKYSLLGVSMPYTVDNTILTLNSPDLELSEELDNFDFTNCKCRIVGYIPIDSRRSYHTMAANHALDFQDNIKTYFNTDGYNKASQHITGSKFRLNLGSAHYVDSNNPLPSPGLYIYEDVNIYPWNNSILHKKYTEEDIEKIVDNKYGSGYVIYESYPVEQGVLKYNRTSNLLISSRTRYLNHPVDFYNEDRGEAYIEEGNTIIYTHNGITTPILFNSKENIPIYIPHPNGKDINVLYSGNVDRIINSDVLESSEDLTCHIQYKSTKHLVFGIKYSRDEDYLFQVHQILPTPFVISTVANNEKQVANSVEDYAVSNFWNQEDYVTYRQDLYHKTMYQSNNEVYDGYDWGWFNYYTSYERTDSWYANGIVQDAIELLDYTGNPYYNYATGVMSSFPQNGSFDYNLKDMGILWLGEIHKDIPENQRFGGNTEEAFLNNKWYIAGPEIAAKNLTSGLGIIEWLEGDTYFQRYDTLKTYSGSTENKNNVTEILSFFCESRVNPDSRYDNNRNKQDNTPMTPQNFNLVNPAYSLQYNFTDIISYSIIPEYISENTNFPSDIVWSLSKKTGERIDTWTKINTVSSISLNSSYGKINAIKNINDSLLVFQDKGISNVLYNENVQIASTTGIPIEIANSGKVDGYRILSNQYGCVNKWSIQNTKKGLYFIDDYTKNIVFFNGQFKSLSREKGFNSWIRNYIDNAPQAFTQTTQSKFGNIITHYDKITDDVYFTTDTESLNFSEVLDEFQSFLSYDRTCALVNLKGKSYLLKNIYDNYTNNYHYEIHKMYEGDYNNLLNTQCSYGIEILVNPEPTEDKVFNTLEFRADTWSAGSLTNDTFDYLAAETEYQHGTSILQNKQGYPSNLKKKFRIWRANIPRDDSNKRDRIRNTWAKIKLYKYNFQKEKTVLHDVQVNYFV